LGSLAGSFPDLLRIMPGSWAWRARRRNLELGAIPAIQEPIPASCTVPSRRSAGTTLC
jgi:hypothetical protein